jgi:hypothetical protein
MRQKGAQITLYMQFLKHFKQVRSQWASNPVRVRAHQVRNLI